MTIEETIKYILKQFEAMGATRQELKAEELRIRSSVAYFDNQRRAVCPQEPKKRR